MGYGTAAPAGVDNLVKESEGVVGLNTSGHDLPEVADLPVGRRGVGVGDEGLGDFGHGEDYLR